MENTLPLNLRRVKKTNLIINRLHIFTQGFALLALIYYRTNFLFQIVKIRDKNTPFLPQVLVFLSELILSFLWVLSLAFQWNPISRKVFPERLPGNDKLPSIDVFICTTNPIKETSVDVMNTLISAMALDYPADKLHMHLSDDGGSSVTFQAVKEAWKFLKWWIPFCRKYEVKTRCPVAYFSADESRDENEKFSSTEFIAEKKKIEKKYEEFKRRILKIIENTSSFTSRDHDPLIQVINSENCGVDSDKTEMPLLVYVSREKRPFHPHHFKAEALNVLVYNCFSRRIHIILFALVLLENQIRSKYKLNPRIKIENRVFLTISHLATYYSLNNYITKLLRRASLKPQSVYHLNTQNTKYKEIIIKQQSNLIVDTKTYSSIKDQKYILNRLCYLYLFVDTLVYSGPSPPLTWASDPRHDLHMGPDL
ncbi:cellulose synthase G2, partial [Olea europaea subsp. europaea]